MTVNEPVEPYVCVTTAPVVVPPSPKFQLFEYVGVPPVVTVVNVTGELTVGLAGRNVNVVDNWTGAPMVRVFELDAVCKGEEESFAVSVTVNDPVIV